MVGKISIDYETKNIISVLESTEPFTYFLIFQQEIMRDPHSFNEILDVIERKIKENNLIFEGMNLNILLSKALDTLLDIGLFSPGWKKSKKGVWDRAYKNSNEFIEILKQFSVNINSVFSRDDSIHVENELIIDAEFRKYGQGRGESEGLDERYFLRFYDFLLSLSEEYFDNKITRYLPISRKGGIFAEQEKQYRGREKITELVGEDDKEKIDKINERVENFLSLLALPYILSEPIEIPKGIKNIIVLEDIIVHGHTLQGILENDFKKEDSRSLNIEIFIFLAAPEKWSRQAIDEVYKDYNIEIQIGINTKTFREFLKYTNKFYWHIQKDKKILDKDHVSFEYDLIKHGSPLSLEDFLSWLNNKGYDFYSPGIKGLSHDKIQLTVFTPDILKEKIPNEWGVENLVQEKVRIILELNRDHDIEKIYLIPIIIPRLRPLKAIESLKDEILWRERTFYHLNKDAGELFHKKLKTMEKLKGLTFEYKFIKPNHIEGGKLSDS